MADQVSMFHVLDGWCTFFSLLTRVLRDIERDLTLCVDENRLVFYISEVEIRLASLYTLSNFVSHTINDQPSCSINLQQLNTSLEAIADHLEIAVLPSLRAKLELVANELNDANFVDGRLMDEEQICLLRGLGFSWSEIAGLFGISRMTLYRRRQALGLGDESRFSDMSDNDLKAQIISIKKEFPDCGERMVIGALRANGYRVQRHRIRSIIHEVDPINTSLRWTPRVLRRPYSVPGPMSLWHIDGNHKLVRWRMIIHGGIDGYSRLIVYLKCSNNNRSDTVLTLFKSAVEKYGLPSRLRCDRGVENMDVGRYMLEKRGVDRGSLLVGSSVHNQRVERLWRDVYACVLQLFYRLFYHMEHIGILDPLNEQHIYGLHYIYIPVINKALDDFSNAWNCHSLSTSNSKTPLRIYTEGMLTLQHNNIPALDYFHPISNEYGEEDVGLLPSMNEHTTSAVLVPESDLCITDEQLQLLSLINPLHPSDCYKVDLYCNVLNIFS